MNNINDESIKVREYRISGEEYTDACYAVFENLGLGETPIKDTFPKFIDLIASAITEYNEPIQAVFTQEVDNTEVKWTIKVSNDTLQCFVHSINLSEIPESTFIMIVDNQKKQVSLSWEYSEEVKKNFDELVYQEDDLKFSVLLMTTVGIIIMGEE